MSEARGSDQRLRVLDLACGNARFAQFLQNEEEASAFEYTGVDVSGELLAAAEKRLHLLERSASGVLGTGLLRWRLLTADLVGEALRPPAEATGLPAENDLVALFGLLHHVPAPLMPELLRRAAACVAPGGFLVLSFWQFGELARFRQRRLPWSWAVERGLLRADQIDELDAYDWLLPWGDRDDGRVRYCRFVDGQAVDRLVRDLTAAAEVTETDRFRADGRTGALNLYVLLRRSLRRRGAQLVRSTPLILALR